MNLPVDIIAPVPKPGDAGFFGAVRKHDIHTGIDLYTEDGAAVYATYHGTVVAIEKFTGEHAGSPWWNNTFSILVENEYGVMVYGELEPLESIVVGMDVTVDMPLGYVKRVLIDDKGKNPPAMLHIELYDKGTKESVWWRLGEEKPPNLRDPSILLSSLSYFKYVEIKLAYETSCLCNFYGMAVDTSELPVSEYIKKNIYALESAYDEYCFKGESSMPLLTIADMKDKLKFAIVLELSDWIVK